MVSEGFRRPRRRAVQKTAHIFFAVGAKPGNFQRRSVIQIAAYGTPYNHYSRQLTVFLTANRKFVSGNAFMMPVIGIHIGVCFSQ